MSRYKEHAIQEFRAAGWTDENGRSYVKYRVESVEFSLQDDGQTLKIFLEVNDEQ
jgi:hypothetical protein